MIKIQKIKVKARPVYDITVDGNHNFFANGINVSNCNEITLHSSKDYTYSCVLSSLNLIHWDKIKNSDIVRVAIVFLDCVNQEFIERAKNIRGLEKVVAFARKSRALGLGVCGLHSLFQQKMIAFDSLEAHMLNIEIFKYIREEAEAATAEIAKTWGEPEWCKGYGRANSHLLAVAPTKSCLFYDVKFSGNNEEDVIDYYEFTKRGGLDLDDIMSMTVEMDDGSVRKIKWNDEVAVIRNGVTQHILGYQLLQGDDLV